MCLSGMCSVLPLDWGSYGSSAERCTHMVTPPEVGRSWRLDHFLLLIIKCCAHFNFPSPLRP